MVVNLGMCHGKDPLVECIHALKAPSTPPPPSDLASSKIRPFLDSPGTGFIYRQFAVFTVKLPVFTVKFSSFRDIMLDVMAFPDNITT